MALCSFGGEEWWYVCVVCNFGFAAVMACEDAVGKNVCDGDLQWVGGAFAS